MRKIVCFPVMILLFAQRGVLWLINRSLAFMTQVFAMMGESTDASISRLCAFVLREDKASD